MRIREVTPNKEAIVKLVVRRPGGQEQEIAAVLDTGYTEYLGSGPGEPWDLRLTLPVGSKDRRKRGRTERPPQT